MNDLPCCSNDQGPDFKCKFEVYCHKLCDDFTTAAASASTPRKIKKKINEISNTVGRTVGKRLSGLVGAPLYQL